MTSSSLEQQVVAALQTRNVRLATAESCTGGLLGHRLSNVSGASEVYLGGVIAYANAVKISLLGVDAAMLDQHGAVSKEVAQCMAEGVRRTLHSDWGIGITGIAGPGGGTKEKPVGLVYVGVAGPEGTRAVRNVFSGSRFDIKAQSADCALQILLEELG